MSTRRAKVILTLVRFSNYLKLEFRASGSDPAGFLRSIDYWDMPSFEPLGFLGPSSELDSGVLNRLNFSGHLHS